MGSTIPEAEPSFGENTKDSSTHRLTGGSSGLTPHLPRLLRRTVVAAGLSGLASLAVDHALGRRAFAQAAFPVESPTELQVALPDVAQLISDAVTSWNTSVTEEKTLGEDFQLTGTGTQLTGVFADEQGDSVLFPSMLVTRYNNGEIGIRPLLTEIERKGIDPSMNPPFFGDAAPRNGVFTVNPSPRVIEMAAALGRVLGLSNAQITRAERKGAGGYNSFVIGNNDGDYFGLVEYTSRELAGTIRIANYDTLALQAGLVPQDAMLQQGELAQGGGGATSPDSGTTEAPLSPTEELIAANTELIGSKQYMMNGHPMEIIIRAGAGANYILGLDGTSPNNPNPTPGLPDMPDDAINQILAKTEPFKTFREITFVTLKPGDPLIDSMPNHNSGNGTSYNEYEGEPTIKSGKFGANLEGDRLTFIWRTDALTNVKDPNVLRKVRKSIATSLVTALIDGGEDYFLATNMTPDQNLTRWYLARDIKNSALPLPVTILPR